MKDFEKRIERAKKILEELMEQDIPLAKSVELYKEGMKELKEAQKMLEDAKAQIKLIQQEDEQCE